MEGLVLFVNWKYPADINFEWTSGATVTCQFTCYIDSKRWGTLGNAWCQSWPCFRCLSAQVLLSGGYEPWVRFGCHSGMSVHINSSEALKNFSECLPSVVTMFPRVSVRRCIMLCRTNGVVKIAFFISPKWICFGTSEIKASRTWRC